VEGSCCFAAARISLLGTCGHHRCKRTCSIACKLVTDSMNIYINLEINFFFWLRKLKHANNKLEVEIVDRLTTTFYVHVNFQNPDGCMYLRHLGEFVKPQHLRADGNEWNPQQNFFL
jgi:hypothetical protein